MTCSVRLGRGTSLRLHLKRCAIESTSTRHFTTRAGLDQLEPHHGGSTAASPDSHPDTGRRLRTLHLHSPFVPATEASPHRRSTPEGSASCHLASCVQPMPGTSPHRGGGPVKRRALPLIVDEMLVSATVERRMIGADSHWKARSPENRPASGQTSGTSDGRIVRVGCRPGSTARTKARRTSPTCSEASSTVNRPSVTRGAFTCP